ncbi:MAG: ABC transporter ATP-binding protein, partial [Blastocatellia bacterium]|nr:ABC transporter ATP-binding protein [Blastocatellia bacterium]
MGQKTNEVTLTGISKRFGTLRALDQVDFSVKSGEIHALLGENGAGKSTLMKVLFGLCRPDAGKITRNGQPLLIRTPQDAVQNRIGMVHQHFHLVDSFTVRENVVLGKRAFPKRTGTPSAGFAPERLETAATRLQLGNVLERKVGSLSVGVRQRVEILKALAFAAEFLLLDEPTSVLTPQETEDLFQTLRELRQQGVGIVLITHKLKEVLSVCDRVTVMRQGQVVGMLPIAAATENELARMMVGRAISGPKTNRAESGREARLVVDCLTTPRTEGQVALQSISFEIRTGEIFGIAGVDGNGQTELAECLAGIRAATGKVWLEGQPVTGNRRERIQAGLAYVPQDRRNEGLALDFSLAENGILGVENRRDFRFGPFLNPAAIHRHVAGLMQKFDVRAASPAVPARSLSGGNQQKLLLARELAFVPKLLIAVNPTWGVDIGAIENIHRILLDLRAAGGSILLISTELDELYALCDRFAVLSG